MYTSAAKHFDQLPQDQQAFVVQRQCRHIQSDLWQTPWGARTISDAMEMERLSRQWNARVLQAATLRPIVSSSIELENRNEQCIEMYGCGSF